MTNWKYMNANVYVSERKDESQIATRYMRVGVDLSQGVKITNRIWVKSDNPDAYGGDEIRHTPVGLTYELRNQGDLNNLVQQFAELIQYIEANTDFTTAGIGDIKEVVKEDVLTEEVVQEEEIKVEIKEEGEDVLELEEVPEEPKGENDQLELDDEESYEGGDGGDIPIDEEDDLDFKDLEIEGEYEAD